MKKLRISILVLPALLVFLSLSGEAKEVKKDFHESFDVEKGTTFHLKHGDGDVNITPWERDVVDVQVHYRADIHIIGIGSEPEFDVEFRQTKNDVYVTGKERSGSVVGIQSINRYEYIYNIKAPHYVKLELEGDDGDVNIKNWRKSIDCHLDDGDIELQDIIAKKVDIKGEDGSIQIDKLSGELSVKCDDGDVRLTECEIPYSRLHLEDGNVRITRSSVSLDVELDDGDLTLNQTKAEKLNIQSEDGDINLELLKTDNLDLDITTDDGDVDIDLEKGISTSFYLHSYDGRVNVELSEIENFEDERHTKSGQIRGGNGRIKVHTSDGNINLRETI